VRAEALLEIQWLILAMSDKRPARLRVPSETSSRAARSDWMDTAQDSVHPFAIVRTGGCLCGKIRYRVTGDPRVHHCHCDMCRRATASAFAVLAWLPSAEVFWQSEETTYRRSPPLAQRGFCQACVPPLALAYRAAVDEIACMSEPWTILPNPSRNTITDPRGGSAGFAAASTSPIAIRRSDGNGT